MRISSPATWRRPRSATWAFLLSALERKRLAHREVGPLTLTMQTFDVRSAPGQELVVYHAEPGSPSSDALTLLGSLAAVPATRRPGT